MSRTGRLGTAALASMFFLAACTAEQATPSQTPEGGSSGPGPSASREPVAVETVPVTFTAVRDPQNATQISIADNAGFFEEEGVDVTVEWVTSFSDLYAPAGAGEIDFTTTSTNNGLKFNQQNIPMSYVAMLTNIAGGQGVVINREMVSSPEDLQNVPIGMSAGATVELAIRNFAEEYGLDFDAIEFVNLQPPDQLAEFSAGNIGAIAAWQPWLHRAVDEFGGTLYFTGNESFIPGDEGGESWLSLPSGVLASDRLIAEEPDTVQAVVNALVRANQLAIEDPDRAAELIAEDMKVDVETMKRLMPFNVYTSAIDDATIEGMQGIQQFLLDTGVLKPEEEVDVEEMIDRRFLEAALGN